MITAHLYLKAVLVSSLTALFFFISISSCLSQSTTSINLDYNNTPLSIVLVELAQNSGYDISFNESYFKDKVITCSKKDVSISKALNYLLKDTDVSYSITNSDIILRKYLHFSGSISDIETGEKLIGAHVFDPSSGKGASSNLDGIFHIRIPSESLYLEFSYIGFKSEKFQIENLDNNSQHNFRLERDYTLDPVIITSTDNASITDYLAGQDILQHQLNTITATGGEPDIMQYLFTQPGVAAGPDGLGGLHVRSSQPDQNLILLDGIPVYNSAHTFGLYSIFNSDLINTAEFKKSGFTANESGRVGSLLNLKLKDGSLQQWQSHLSVSTLATGFMTNGPIIKDKLGILVAARRTHIDPFIEAFTKNEKEKEAVFGESSLNFRDIYGKLNYHHNSNNKFSLLYYEGKDYYRDEGDDTCDCDDFYQEWIYFSDFIWGNRAASLKWNHIFNNHVFNTSQLSYSRFSFDSFSDSEYYYEDFFTFDFEEEYLTVGFLSHIADLTFNNQTHYYINDKQEISFGLQLSRKNYNPGTTDFESIYYGVFDEEIIEFYDSITLNNELQSQDITLSINDKWKITEKTALNLGLNGSYFTAEDLLFGDVSSHKLYQANIQLAHKFSKNFDFSLALDRMYQPIHVLSTSSINFPNELWVPSTSKLKPQNSQQVELGLNYQNKNWQLSTNAYYRELKNLPRYNFSANIPSLLEITTELWESETIVGEGDSYGIEFNSIYAGENFKSMISYTWSESNRRFAELNSGLPFPDNYSLNHVVSINLLGKIKNNFWLYANWNYRSGLNQTLYSSPYTYSAIQNQFELDFEAISAINADKEIPYHRLDIGIKLSKKSAHLEHQLSLGVQNVYNRKNQYFSYDLNDTQSPELSGRQSKLALPLLPTLTYKLLIKGK